MHTISFPKIGNYDIPVYYLLTHITGMKILIPNINLKTMEAGAKNSPDFVCAPFKYTLGTMIESIEKGADILIQFGGGCRYGYYASLQEEILKNLGYNCKLYNLIVAGHTDIKRIYNIIREIDSNIKLRKVFKYGIISIKMVKYMDKIDDYIRQNIGFEIEKGTFIKLKKKMLKDFSNVKSLFELKRKYHRYKKLFKKIKINKPNNYIKIGLIGELYTLMEENANYNIEYTLASYGVSIKRFTNVTYLLFKKHKLIKKYLKRLKNMRYKIGADGLDNIYHTKYLCDNGYDGIIHIKSSFCTPEIGAMPIINKMAKEKDVPVMFLSFDTNTSKVGVETRVEAFIDMLEMRKNE